MKLSLGISTCPNDTFIFDALIHHKIDTEGLDFEVTMTDVEELNKLALNNQIDITKLSYSAYGHVVKNYQLLTAGSALGRKNGPLLISKRTINSNEVENLRIAIPGKYTTANMLFRLFFSKKNRIKELLFSDIEEAILKDEVDAGVIIHENRFTYQKKGLKKIADLGELWEKETEHPIPLGGIAVKRSFDAVLKQKINRVVERSVQYAFDHPQASHNFVKQYAKEMEKETVEKHIQLYVNNYTLDLEKEGRGAVEFFIEKLKKQGIIQYDDTLKIFVQ